MFIPIFTNCHLERKYLCCFNNFRTITLIHVLHVYNAMVHNFKCEIVFYNAYVLLSLQYSGWGDLSDLIHPCPFHLLKDLLYGDIFENLHVHALDNLED